MESAGLAFKQFRLIGVARDAVRPGDAHNRAVTRRAIVFQECVRLRERTGTVEPLPGRGSPRCGCCLHADYGKPGYDDAARYQPFAHLTSVAKPPDSKVHRAPNM